MSLSISAFLLLQIMPLHGRGLGRPCSDTATAYATLQSLQDVTRMSWTTSHDTVTFSIKKGSLLKRLCKQNSGMKSNLDSTLILTFSTQCMCTVLSIAIWSDWRPSSTSRVGTYLWSLKESWESSIEVASPTYMSNNHILLLHSPPKLVPLHVSLFILVRIVSGAYDTYSNTLIHHTEIPDVIITTRTLRRVPKGSPAVQQDMIYAPRKGDRILSSNYTDLTTPANWLEADPPGAPVCVCVCVCIYIYIYIYIYMHIHARMFVGKYERVRRSAHAYARKYIWHHNKRTYTHMQTHRTAKMVYERCIQKTSINRKRGIMPC